MKLEDIKFIKETDLDFDSMTIKKVRYFIQGGDPWFSEVIHEMTLEDPSTNKLYYLTFIAPDIGAQLYITEKSFVEWFMELEESSEEEDEDVLIEICNELFIFASIEDGLVDCDKEVSYYNALKILATLNMSDIEETDKAIPYLIDKKVKDIEIDDVTAEEYEDTEGVNPTLRIAIK